MVTARISPVADPDEEQAKLLAKSLPGPDGQPLNIFKTLAHAPELLRRVNALGGYFFVHGSIAIRDRELVILRVAGGCRSAYEAGQHRWIARDAGLDIAEIDAALDSRIDHAWSDRDAALLAFTDDVLASDTVSEASWNRLADRGDAQRLDLLVLVGYYRLLAATLNGVCVELDQSVADLIRP